MSSLAVLCVRQSSCPETVGLLWMFCISFADSVHERPRHLGDVVTDAMPRTTALFEQLPGGSLRSVSDEARDGEGVAADDRVVLRGGLAEKSARWSEYARLCVQGLGPDDPRTVDAVRKAEQIAGACDGQRALLRAGLVRPAPHCPGCSPPDCDQLVHRVAYLTVSASPEA